MKIFFRILKYLKPYWFRLSCSILCILLFTITSSASLMSIIPFLNTIFKVQSETLTINAPVSDTTDGLLETAVPKSFNNLWKSLKHKLYGFFSAENRRLALQRVCLVIIILIFLKNLFSYLQAYFMAFVEQGVIKDIRDDLYKHINKLSLSYYHKTRTGHIISRITNDVTLINNGISASFVTLVKNPLLIIFSLGLAFIISWQLTLIALVVAPFSLAIIGWISLKLRRQSVDSQEKLANVTTVLQETISGVRIVKAFAMEDFEIKKFMNETRQYFKALIKINITRNLSSPITEFLGTCVGVGILWFGGDMVLRGQLITPDEFIFFLLLIFSIMQPVKELTSVNNRIQEALAAGSRIFSVLDQQPEICNVVNPVKKEQFDHSIRFSGVSFGYNKNSQVLTDIHIEVTKGEILAIVGPSGAGKSTMVDLLPRFYDPVKGAIFMDGIDIREIDFASLRRLMGFVTQETILFNDSVRSNIAYGLVDRSLDDVIQAAKIANAHEFIENLPDYYDTNIGERGVTLSGGQRQRLAIARAILKNPPILILDEATSALDTESEVLVQQAIERLMKNRTTFVIAHRLSTILNADRIIVLEKGKIVQSGKHEELITQPGLYQKLYNMQFR